MTDDWRTLGACDASTPHLLPDDLPREVEDRLTWQAQAVCRACPVLDECRYWALHFDLPLAGVVGGFTERMRVEWRRDVLGVVTPDVVSAVQFLPKPDPRPRPHKETA